MKNLVLSLSLVFLLSGCISYEYKGSCAGAASETVKIYSDAGSINKKEYTLLGVATASGTASSVSKESICVKLGKEAKACGADVVLITAYQVVPESQNAVSGVHSGFDYDESNVNWQQMSRDIDGNYGNIRGSGAAVNTGSYRRIVRAEFLKRNAAEIKAEQR